MNEVKEGESHIFDIGYRENEVGHLWSELKNDQASAVYFDASFEKAFKIDDITSVFHYELLANDGGLNSCMTEAEDPSRCKELDEMLHGDGMPHLHSALSLLKASENFTLDIDFDKKVPELDYHFSKELSFGNLKSEIRSPGTSNEVGGSELGNLLDKQSSSRMYGASRSRSECEKPTEDEAKCPVTSESPDFNEATDAQTLLKMGRPFNDISDFPIESTEASCSLKCLQYDVLSVSEGTEAVDFSMDEMSSDSDEVSIAGSRQRRTCRPPQRYIEGSLWVKPKPHGERKTFTRSTKCKEMGQRSRKKHCHKASERKASKSIRSDSELDSDEEYCPLPSDFISHETVRRKNTSIWTLNEIVKLIDGLSHFGLGQWTAVKKTFFSSSSRTPTDIRDKWRNLVKTHCQNTKGKRKDEPHHKNCSRSLPDAVVERVRELARSPPVCKSRSKRGGTPSRSPVTMT